MLEKDPAQRISSADQLARHLDVLAAEIAEDPFGSSRYARRTRRDGQAPSAQRSSTSRNGAPQPGPSHARRQTPFGGGRHTTVANAQSAPPSPDRGTPAGGYGSGTPAGGYGSGTPAGGYGSGPFGSGAHGSDSAGYGTTSGAHGTDAYGRPYSAAPGTPAGAPGSGSYGTNSAGYGTDSSGYGSDSAGYGTTSGTYGTDAQGRPHGSGYVPPPTSGPQGAGNGGRAYPSRRDLHSTRQDGRRVPQQGRSGGHPGKRRSLSSDIQRWVGGIEDRVGVRVSWPLVALVALLLVILIIMLVTGGGDDGALQEPWGSSEIYAETLNSPAAATLAASGMMLLNEPYALRQTAMTSKDV
jgi:serine/threonine-protein kinase